MWSHRSFFFCTEYLRRPPCRRISPWSGNYGILRWWKFVGLYPQAGAMYYSGNFEMGKYAEQLSGRKCVHPILCTLISLFWYNFLGCGCLRFQHWFDGAGVSFEKQNLSGNVKHKKIWREDVYYYGWTCLLDSAVQHSDCTFLVLASLDIGGG